MQMHNDTTRNEFRRLRIGGCSLSSIGRQLGVSKPTVIKWNRQLQTELGPATADGLQNSQTPQLPNSPPTHGTHDHSCSFMAPPLGELTELRRKQNVLRQELVSRALKDVPTTTLETMAGELRKRIEHLESLTTPKTL